MRNAEEVNRLLLTGRDCLEQTLEKVCAPLGENTAAACNASLDALRACHAQFMQQRQRIIEDEERAIREGRRPGMTGAGGPA